MKKLIVALGAAVFAFGVQAAAVNWHFSVSGEDMNAEELAGTVTLYFNDVLLGTAVYEYGAAEGDFEVDSAGGTIKAIATITNFADGAGTLEYTYVMPALPLPGYPDVDSSLGYVNTTISDAITSDGTIDISMNAADNGFTPAAPVIPEPTTGLLVLLGIAGLALKRKQA